MSAARRRRRSALLAGLAVGALVAGLAPAAQADVRIGGSGWGHGVGMSQYGAREQAADGRTHQQILAHYYRGTTTAWARDDQVLRVQVLSSDKAVTVRTRALDSGGGAFRVGAGSTVVDGKVGDTVTFAVAGTGIAATVRFADGRTTQVSGPGVGFRWSGTRQLSPGGARSLAEVPGASGATGNLNMGAGTGLYRHGHLEVSAIGGRVNVSNDVRLHDEYLNGIAEMPSSWPAEALKTQAVTARTYALRKAAGGIRAACNCHVTDEVADQKFTGWAKEAEPGWGDKWVAAVQGTTRGDQDGKVATYGGALIDAVYYSSSGGRTQNSEDVWTSALPYLRGVDDPWSLRASNPNRRWSETRTDAQLASAFGLRDVDRLEITARTGAGAVRTARATSAAGATVTISGEQLRSRLSLKSTWMERGSTRAAGNDRFATAVAVGREASASGRTVVLANGTTSSLVDGMVAGPLARAVGGPLLLTERDRLPAVTEQEIRRRGATRVLVVGNDGVVSAAVVNRLKALGVTTVERLGGHDRYATAAAVAGRMGARNGRALIANGDNASLVDTAGASGPAAHLGRPILLVARDSVPTATATALRDLKVGPTHCVGNEGVISAAVQNQLSCTRIGGQDRYATAAAVARAFRTAVPQDRVVVAPGRDASLVDTVASGSLGRLIVLADTGAPSPSTVRAVQELLGVDVLVAVGGPAVVADGTIATLRRV